LGVLTANIIISTNTKINKITFLLYEQVSFSHQKTLRTGIVEVQNFQGMKISKIIFVLSFGEHQIHSITNKLLS